LSNLETLKQNQRDGHLATRIKTASKDLQIILRDLQRDCKPYWKFSELERELLDIAHEAGKLTADHLREVNARKKLKRDILKLKAKVDEQIKELEA